MLFGLIKCENSKVMVFFIQAASAARSLKSIFSHLIGRKRIDLSRSKLSQLVPHSMWDDQKRCSAWNNRVSVWRHEKSCRLFLFSIQKSAFRSKRKSEPFWRIILRVYYGVVVIFISEEKSCMTLFTISK